MQAALRSRDLAVPQSDNGLSEGVVDEACGEASATPNGQQMREPDMLETGSSSAAN
jgi:hypothetical protein